MGSEHAGESGCAGHCQCYLQECLTHCPHPLAQLLSQNLPFSSDCPPCCTLLRDPGPREEAKPGAAKWSHPSSHSPIQVHEGYGEVDQLSGVGDGGRVGDTQLGHPPQ